MSDEYGEFDLSAGDDTGLDELMQALFEPPEEVWLDRDDVVAEMRAETEADDYQQLVSEGLREQGYDPDAQKKGLEGSAVGVQKWFRFPAAHALFQRWLYVLLPERVKRVGNEAQSLSVVTHEGGAVTIHAPDYTRLGDTPLEAAELLRELAYTLEHEDG